VPRSHLWGCLGPLLFVLAAGIIALSSVGLPMAIFLGIFGVDPFTSIGLVVATDRGTLSGTTGALAGGLAMWIAHLANRRIAWTGWLASGIAGYAVGALAIYALVPADWFVAPPAS
jgi:hypothetical protein